MTGACDAAGARSRGRPSQVAVDEFGLPRRPPCVVVSSRRPGYVSSGLLLGCFSCDVSSRFVSVVSVTCRFSVVSSRGGGQRRGLPRGRGRPCGRRGGRARPAGCRGRGGRPTGGGCVCRAVTSEVRLPDGGTRSDDGGRGDPDQGSSSMVTEARRGRRGGLQALLDAATGLVRQACRGGGRGGGDEEAAEAGRGGGCSPC